MFFGLELFPVLHEELSELILAGSVSPCALEIVCVGVLNDFRFVCGQQSCSQREILIKFDSEGVKHHCSFYSIPTRTQ